MAATAAESHDFPKEEENILKLWEELDAFQSCLRQSKDRPRFETFIFTSFLRPGFSLGKFYKINIINI